MKRIAVLTSGGDAPAGNAAASAVTRRAIDAGLGLMRVRPGGTATERPARAARGRQVGWQRGEVAGAPLAGVTTNTRSLDPRRLEPARRLAP